MPTTTDNIFKKLKITNWNKWDFTAQTFLYCNSKLIIQFCFYNVTFFILCLCIRIDNNFSFKLYTSFFIFFLDFVHFKLCINVWSAHLINLKKKRRSILLMQFSNTLTKITIVKMCSTAKHHFYVFIYYCILKPMKLTCFLFCF